MRTKTRILEDREVVPGVPFSRGRLYHLLANPVYAGRIRHRDQTYDGLHEAIIDCETWDRVQAQLSDNAIARKSGSNARNPSPLAGKVFGPDGKPLTPSHACKGTRRYRYYVSAGEDGRPVSRIPAAELERTVAVAITADAEVRLWAGGEPDDPLSFVEQVTIAETMLQIRVRTEASPEPHLITAPFTCRRRGVETRLVLDGAPAARPDPVLIRRVLQAMDWLGRLEAGQAINEIARAEGITPGYVAQHIQLAFLSPKVLRALAAGNIRPDLTARQIRRLEIPPSWADQDAVFF